MEITLSNQSKYDIEINCENQRYLIKNNCVLNINVSKEPLILRASICDEIVQDDVLPKKLLETLSNFALNVDCTYEIKNVRDGMTLDISHDAYTYSGESFFLPFLYTYPVIKNADVAINLIYCFGKNTDEVLRLFRKLAVFARIGTDGILIGALSASFEFLRAKKLCKKERIFSILSKQLTAERGTKQSARE